ncbi:hypothetical protein [Bacillus thermotolerans]|uniref:hypothetical protein n=1 Tax=Bacillus thermotolerans TaxID=1221996 RepID=UPI000588F3D8|nr:hypothetical protein [Bacillus thermotolerans]KKB35318.1 hypothetical protein QY96_03652 [Bacillus thermotolerans]
MKNYLLFTGIFVLAYVLLQIGSGFVLTAFYTPDLTAPSVPLSSDTEFGAADPVSPLIISVLSLGGVASGKCGFTTLRKFSY